MPRRKDYSQLDRPAVAWVDTPASYYGPRMIRVHNGILQSGPELEAFVAKLYLYANQAPTDFKVRNHVNDNQ